MKYISRRYLLEKWESLQWDMNILLRGESDEVTEEERNRVIDNISDKIAAIAMELDIESADAIGGQMDKYIVTEGQIVNAVRYAIELNIEESRIIDILMEAVIYEIETVLEDDCEKWRDGVDE